MLTYFAVIIVVTHAIAFCSWHLIEKPAMSLKDWSPAPLLAALRGGSVGTVAHAKPEPVPDPLPEVVPALAGVTDD
jgi:peptidoglycan/LPS O-acetylase OafA/YrhL